MTADNLRDHLFLFGIWRADIEISLGHVDIFVSKKNKLSLQKHISKFMPVCVSWKIISSDRNWLKNRKKYTYRITVKM